jgi:hypothetical protein
VLLIHNEFEGGIRYVLAFFYYCISLGFFFVYSSPSVHVYIRALDPQMNTSDIPNTDDASRVC